MNNKEDSRWLSSLLFWKINHNYTRAEGEVNRIIHDILGHFN